MGKLKFFFFCLMKELFIVFIYRSKMNIIRFGGRILNPLTFSFNNLRQYGSKFEPPYLDLITHDPQYEEVQIRLRGHDFPTLEKYHEFTCKFAEKQTKMLHFEPEEMGKKGAKVLEEFTLDTYERVVNLADVDASTLPIFMEFIRNHQPEGVTLTAGLPDEQLERFRYIPDMEMNAVKQRLDDINTGKFKFQ